MDRVIYVVSDLHLGPGWLPNGELDPLEDFTSGEEFSRFLHQIGTTGLPVELVIAGDFLEFCQTLPEIGLNSPEDDLGSTEEESTRRARVIVGQDPAVASGHPIVFEALRHFMMEGNSVTIIAGNHDVDLLWDSVWALMFDIIYPPGSTGDLRLVEYSYTIGTGTRGRVHIEHGHEHDRANRFGDKMSQPFGVDRLGIRRLKRCWGTLFVDKVYNQLERERWFIDNIKPILRVVQLGLRNDFVFTATAIGLVVRFLLTSGLPPLLGGTDEAFEEEVMATSIEVLPTTISDPELRAAVERQMTDPLAKSELEQALRGSDGHQLHMLLAGASPRLRMDSLDDVTATPGGEIVLGGGGSEDAYRSAARSILEEDRSIMTVVMGHTHGAIDGHIAPLYLSDGRTGLYFNTGTWTRHLKDEGHQSYSWSELSDEDNYTTLFSYVKLEPDGDGGYRPSLHSWFDEQEW